MTRRDTRSICRFFGLVLVFGPAALACSDGRSPPLVMSADSGASSGDGPATVSPGPGGRVPAEHRPQAVACLPSTRAPQLDGGGASCTTDAECAGDAGALFSHCLRGRCAFDACLDDADCGNGVCGCSTDYYGGNGAFHPNVCVSANCHVDSDCGAGGYCSPNRGRCGVFEGFYCHRPSDACYNAIECAGTTGPNACLYTPTVGAFICAAGAICNG
jgi:hypothetical protein